MKTFTFLIVVVSGIFIIACSKANEKTTEELLQNPQTEEEIFSAIISDKERFEKFVERMMYNENSKLLLQHHSSLVKLVCSAGKVDSLMRYDTKLMESMTHNLMNIVERDSVACDKTCAKMLESDRFRHRILEQIKAKK